MNPYYHYYPIIKTKKGIHIISTLTKFTPTEHTGLHLLIFLLIQSHGSIIDLIPKGHGLFIMPGDLYLHNDRYYITCKFSALFPTIHLLLHLILYEIYVYNFTNDGCMVAYICTYIVIFS